MTSSSHSLLGHPDLFGLYSTVNTTNHLYIETKIIRIKTPMINEITAEHMYRM